MVADIINFRTAKKAADRKASLSAADQNRVRFGRTKVEKARDKELAAKAARDLDNHRRDDEPSKP